MRLLFIFLFIITSAFGHGNHEHGDHEHKVVIHSASERHRQNLPGMMVPVSVTESTTQEVKARPKMRPLLHRVENLEKVVMRLLKEQSIAAGKFNNYGNAIITLDKRQKRIAERLVPLETDEHYHDKSGTMLLPTTAPRE